MLAFDPDLVRAVRLMVPYGRRLLLVLAISLLSTLVSLYLPLLSRDFVDEALLGRDIRSLYGIVGRFGAITVASFALNIISGLRYTRVSAEILFDMRLEMYRHLQRLSPRFYARTRIGDIMSRINNDVGEIQRIAAETALAWVGNVLFLVGTVGMLAWLDVRMFVLTALATPLSLWALAIYRRRLENHVADVRQRSADIGSFLIQSVHAMKLTVNVNAQEREVDRFRHHNQAFIRSLMSMQLLTYLSGGLPGLILSASTGVVFLYGGIHVIDGSLTMGTFVAFMAYQMRFLAPMQALMGLWANLATARVSFRRVAEILDVPVEVAESPDAIPMPRVRGDVAFRHVTLTFDRGSPVLDDVSFEVRPGEVVAIVGPSGSGKSTIADLLLRNLDPDAGAVTLDGCDLRDLRLEDIHRHIAVVEQDPILLHATVAENIRYGRPEATLDEVRRAARLAALDTFVASLPQGYETVVGERGMALSAGERQRLATARAFLRDSPVLILDEPTAALDVLSERAVVAGYEASRRHRTTIVITHRLDVASRADRVIVLSGAPLIDDRAPGAVVAAGGALTVRRPAPVHVQ
ncbi:MAG: ABC transporter ATP-binding protein [Vicinamibacterales bacterium]